MTSSRSIAISIWLVFVVECVGCSLVFVVQIGKRFLSLCEDDEECDARLPDATLVLTAVYDYLNNKTTTHPCQGFFDEVMQVTGWSKSVLREQLQYNLGNRLGADPTGNPYREMIVPLVKRLSRCDAVDQKVLKAALLPELPGDATSTESNSTGTYGSMLMAEIMSSEMMATSDFLFPPVRS